MTALTFTTKLFQAIHKQHDISVNEFEVLIAIKSGCKTTQSIADFYGLGVRAIFYRLKPLIENTLITRTDDFHYELTMFGEGALTQIFNFLND